jgi:carbon monoxide dehydrogenase subunit G
MRFHRQLSTPRPSQEVFDLIGDPLRFGALFPDCQGVQLGATTCFTVNISVGAGQLRSTLAFQLDKIEAQPPARLRYLGNGEAARSQISFELAFDIAPNSAGTHVHCDCSVEVTGPVTLLAPEMADHLGSKKLDQLLSNLQASLAAGPS